MLLVRQTLKYTTFRKHLLVVWRLNSGKKFQGPNRFYRAKE